MRQNHPSRIVGHRMAVLRHAAGVTGNVAATYRCFVMSRPTFCTYANRLDLEGPDGLKERSRALKSHPQATSAEMVGKTIHCRQTYHPGLAKI